MGGHLGAPEHCCSTCRHLDLFRLADSWEDICGLELGWVAADQVCDFWQQPYVEVDYVGIIQ